ncbi:dynein regulatory complex protein 10 [Strix aluco]|uniref:dynein regulatory complex protein 10 n=1 Tax=Strix aluco TaxID=111821 RepID=UPI003DA53677
MSDAGEQGMGVVVSSSHTVSAAPSSSGEDSSHSSPAPAWGPSHQSFMNFSHAEYEEVHAAYVEEKAQLSLLTEKHAVLLQEYSQIEEERRVRQEKEEQALKELNTMTLAATRIQAFWRGYLVRSLFKSKRKKKKGKGKGKKAKK